MSHSKRETGFHLPLRKEGTGLQLSNGKTLSEEDSPLRFAEELEHQGLGHPEPGTLGPGPPSGRGLVRPDPARLPLAFL